MVRVGIVGFGFMGQTHWRCYERLREKTRVIAIADENPRRAAGDTSGTWGNLGDGAQHVDFSGVATTIDWRELIAMVDVDVVDVCVPTPFHAEMVTASLAAGKHVLCEKPLTRTLSEAQAVGKAAASARSFLMPAMCMRFWPEWVWLKQVVSDGRYGNVLSASFVRQGTVPPGWYRHGASSGGALLDLHIHDTDFVCHLFGKPHAVSSRGYRASSGHIDHVSTQFHYDNIPLVVADGGWSFAEPYPFRMRYTVNFEERVTADFDLSRAQSLVVYERGQETPITCEAIDGWYGTIRYFVNCVLEAKRPTVVTVEDAIRSVEVVEAEARSIASNRIEAL